MESVKLDGGEYGGTYKLIGEQVCFDFTNTVAWRDTDEAHDWLSSPENFLTWSLAAKTISKQSADFLRHRSGVQSAKELKTVIKIREELRELLAPIAFDKKPDPGSIKNFELLLQNISGLRHIHPTSFEWVWNPPKTLIEAVAPVIWNAAEVLTHSDHSRVRHCAGCDWLFYDSTRNRSRKWCDMGDCGSRDKSLRYYHRKKDEN